MPSYSEQVRPIAASEISLLKQFLYAAIFVPPGVEPPAFSVVDLPELKAYIIDFGSCRGDFAFVAEKSDKLIGAAWCRLLPEYDWLGPDIPVLTLAVMPPYRGQGIGTTLLCALLNQLQQNGYHGLALSVQRRNPAVRLYRKMKFELVAEKGDEWIMCHSFPAYKK